MQDGGSHTVTKYSNKWYLKYTQWRDISGSIAGLERFNLAFVTVRTEVVYADDATKMALARVEDCS